MATAGKPALSGLHDGTACRGERPVTSGRAARGIALLVLMAACVGQPDDAATDAGRDSARTPSSDARGPTRAASSDTVPHRDPDVFTERVAVFLLADNLDALADEYGEEDWAVVGDDMMWYRAEAWQWLEDHRVPVVSLAGRPPLRFRVDGAVRTYGFADRPTLDVVVLYEPDREPLAVPPIEVGATGAAYFAEVGSP